jgi:hypothetical protein
MCRYIRWTSIAITLTLAAACGEQTSDTGMATTTDNGLLAGWTGPYGGVPAFDRMDLADLKPALGAGMEMELAEIVPGHMELQPVVAGVPRNSARDGSEAG